MRCQGSPKIFLNRCIYTVQKKSHIPGTIDLVPTSIPTDNRYYQYFMYSSRVSSCKYKQIQISYSFQCPGVQIYSSSTGLQPVNRCCYEVVEMVYLLFITPIFSFTSHLKFCFPRKFFPDSLMHIHNALFLLCIINTSICNSLVYLLNVCLC